MMSAMNLQETQEFDADPDRVFAMLCDQAWREEVCRATHAIDYSVSVEKSGGTVTVRTTRVLPAEIPEPFKSMVGDRIEIVQVETWPAEPDRDGTRQAEVDMTRRRVGIGPPLDFAVIDISCHDNRPDTR